MIRLFLEEIYYTLTIRIGARALEWLMDTLEIEYDK